MTVVVLAFCFGFGYRANHIISYESFYITPKILPVSLLTTKEHPYKVKKIYKAVSWKLIYIRFLTLSLIMKKLPCRFFYVTRNTPEKFRDFWEKGPWPQLFNSWIGYPEEKCYQNLFSRLLDSDLSNGEWYPTFENLGPDH